MTGTPLKHKTPCSAKVKRSPSAHLSDKENEKPSLLEVHAAQVQREVDEAPEQPASQPSPVDISGVALHDAQNYLHVRGCARAQELLSPMPGLVQRQGEAARSQTPHSIMKQRSHLNQQHFST